MLTAVNEHQWSLEPRSTILLVQFKAPVWFHIPLLTFTRLLGQLDLVQYLYLVIPPINSPFTLRAWRVSIRILLYIISFWQILLPYYLRESLPDASTSRSSFTCEFL